MKTERPETGITPKEYERILPDICDAKISRYPDKWTPENPLFGTCVPVAVVARRLFGGKLLRASLRPFPEFSGRYMFWHWANLLPGDKVKDFTRFQFEEYPEGLDFEIRPPYKILRLPDVVYRSNLLYKRLMKVI